MAAREDITPTVDDVALLMRTRTVAGVATGLGADTGAGEITTFDETTRPTATEVAAVIEMAVDTVVGQVPGTVTDIPVEEAPVVKEAVTLYAAVLTEASFWREQANQTLITLWRDLYADVMAGIREKMAATTLEGPGAWIGTLYVGTIREEPETFTDGPIKGIDY
jgi:hypothetical protein